MNSQSSLTGESWITEKTADAKENQRTPLLELKNICFMVCKIMCWIFSLNTITLRTQIPILTGW
jgi:hypothetical protein